MVKIETVKDLLWHFGYNTEIALYDRGEELPFIAFKDKTVINSGTNVKYLKRKVGGFSFYNDLLDIYLD